jgi:uncharacterized membrane protein
VGYLMTKDHEKLLHDLEKSLHDHVTQNHKLILIMAVIALMAGVFVQKEFMIFPYSTFLMSMGSFFLCVVFILIALLFTQFHLDLHITHKRNHFETSRKITCLKKVARISNLLAMMAFIVGLFAIFSCCPKDDEITLKNNAMNAGQVSHTKEMSNETLNNVDISDTQRINNVSKIKKIVQTKG